MHDERFLAAIEACTLEEFHHRDHIKIAYLYSQRHPLDEAIAKVRTGLQALAVAWRAPVDDLEKGLSPDHDPGVGATRAFSIEKRQDCKER